LRGLNNAKLELNLVSISHNLKKIWKVKRELVVNKDKNKIIFNFWIIPQKLNVTQPDMSVAYTV